MIQYDKLAEELIIRLEQGKNPNNYYVGNLSSVQESFDVICLKPSNSEALYSKEVYQVKSGTYCDDDNISKSHVVNADFEKLQKENVKFLFLVVYNVPTVEDEGLPIIFRIPVSSLKNKERKKGEKVVEKKENQCEIYYNGHTLTYTTFFKKDIFQVLEGAGYVYFNRIKPITCDHLMDK